MGKPILRFFPEEGEENAPAVAPDEADDLADLSDEDAENDGGADDVKGRSRRTQVG